MMGLRIYCPDETARIPRPTVLELTCDGDHGLLPALSQRFDHPDGFVRQHAAAMQAGWRETFEQERGRVFLGPCCSGKRAIVR